MDDCQRSVPLRSGGVLTLQAWGLGQMAAHASDFVELLEFFGAVLSGRTTESDLSTLPAQSVALIERLITASLCDSADQGRIRVSDLGTLLPVIFELNDLDGLLKNLLGLRLRLIQLAQPDDTSSASANGSTSTDTTS